MNSISQFPLLNASGKPVEFAIDEWGELHEHSYDYLQAHRHHFYEIMFFEGGESQHDIDFRTFNTIGLKIHFIAPDNVHLLIRGQDSLGFSLQFVSGLLYESLLSQLPFFSENPTMDLSEELYQQVIPLITLLRNEINRNDNLSSILIRSLLQSALLLMVRDNTAAHEFIKQPEIPTHISEFKSLIQLNYKEHLSVEGYAQLLHLSVKHLIALCKKHTGKTPLKLIQEKLISEAKKELFYTHKSIKEIAIDLGFEDPANFSNYFKTATGYSPAAYRATNR